MKKLDKTINLLKKVIKYPNCKRMNKSTVVGFLGELLVERKLEEEGLNVLLKGNQSGHDLEVKGKEIRIDVKTSTFKDEFSIGKAWGWALKSKTKRVENITCTHFVLVALDNSLEVVAYYVLNKTNLEHFTFSSSRYRTLEYRFGVLPGTIPKHAKNEDRKYIEESRKCMKKGRIKKIYTRNKLSNALII